MNRANLYLSTIDPHAGDLARSYGLGVEIAEFSTAWNMDDKLEETDAALQETLPGVEPRILHAPFNELFPCAIDPCARKLAAQRYRQAIGLAKRYGAGKVVIHGGYNPFIYYPIWYTQQSILFWKEFLQDDPGVELVLENVLEEEPGMLAEIVAGVNHPRLRLCLDVGHVNAYAKTAVMEWVKAWAPWLSHMHLHNNDGTWDTHSALNQGTIPVKEMLERLQTLRPDMTLTLELTDAQPSLRWLQEETPWIFKP